MRDRLRFRILLLLSLGAGAAAVAWALFVQAPPGPRALQTTIDAEIGDAELAMWQAYYEKRKVDLFARLAMTLRRQYRYPWSKAVRNGFFFARAAARFGDMRGGYDAVLPDLEQGFDAVRRWTGASFDVHAVARAELAWWVARRTPGEDSPENVGRLIGEQYSAFYGVRGAGMDRAGLLRAQAAALRDASGARADWATIGKMLHESYAALSEALARPRPSGS